ncbi:DNA polymerase III subunit beta [Methylococcus sp. EFPC2]|uniref:DNA polymerase III subunit beta n=1 Tax=Methylococcus sp. EFPC2 TaxID=2812648 RepID=UPI001966EEB1|nr:DNA polymerase III subunit beta [Methylococcus sp. EFPC2]QSA95989.1 DNA polymerase III subunit beta [Methylococcus sp. EFPC2]
MKFAISRENLLTPLQQVIGVIEKRQTMAILANVLARLNGDRLELVGTDLEVQLVTHTLTESGEEGEFTAPARKLLDICRTLPEGGVLKIEVGDDKLSLQSGRSRFSLATLPAENYPVFDAGQAEVEFTLAGGLLKQAMEKTLFAMAQQDVRYYLNGLLLDLDGDTLRTVASDGHRLALFEENVAGLGLPSRQVIIPRKGVLELYRLIRDDESPITVQISANNIRLTLADLSFAAKLIEGRFPDYRRVMPAQIARVVTVEKDALKAALTRVSILAADKFRGVALDLSAETLKLSAQNPEHDQAEEEIEIRLEGEPFEVGFNAAYLLDAANNIDSDTVRLSFTETASSCLIEDPLNPRYKSIVMPMRL